MWFKNAILYRIPQHTQLDAATVELALDAHRHTPLPGNQIAGRGWVPTHNDQLVYKQGGNLLFTMRHDKRLLPPSVVAEALKARVQKVEDEQGFRPGRKQTKELKEQVIDELLPTAFVVSAEVAVWVDTLNGWLVVNTSSLAKADYAVSLLIKSLEKLSLETLHVSKPISTTLTEWLSEGEAPSPFTVDQDAILTGRGEGGGKIQYTKQTLEADEMQRQIATGKQCVRLAMTWADKVSFILTDSAQLRRIKPLDLLTEMASADKDEDAFATDFALMTGELSKLFGALIEAFGGIRPKEVQ